MFEFQEGGRQTAFKLLGAWQGRHRTFFSRFSLGVVVIWLEYSISITRINGVFVLLEPLTYIYFITGGLSADEMKGTC